VFLRDLKSSLSVLWTVGWWRGAMNHSEVVCFLDRHKGNMGSKQDRNVTMIGKLPKWHHDL
jgi:hypothetical protein